MEVKLKYCDSYNLHKNPKGTLTIECTEDYNCRYAEIFLTVEEVHKLILELTTLFPA